MRWCENFYSRNQHINSISFITLLYLNNKTWDRPCAYPMFYQDFTPAMAPHGLCALLSMFEIPITLTTPRAMNRCQLYCVKEIPSD